MRNFKSLAEADNAFAALEAEAAQLRETTAAAQAQAQTNYTNLTAAQADVQRVTAERDQALASVTAEQARAAAAEQSRADLEASIPQRINDEVTRAVAAAGHPPVDAEITPDPARVKNQKVELFGLDRVRAALAKNKN